MKTIIKENKNTDLSNKESENANLSIKENEIQMRPIDHIVTRDGLTGVLPNGGIEFYDPVVGFWYNVASQSFVEVLVKQACRAASITFLTGTYANGTNGVGATLTNNGAQAPLVVDLVNVVVGDRILLKDQTDATQNGVYTVTNAGSLSSNWVITRAVDYDSVYLINPGDNIKVISGTVNGTTDWMQIATVTAVGTSSITFQPLSQHGVLTIAATANQITITGTANNPIISIANNPVIPGTASMALPTGSIAQRGTTSTTAISIRGWNGS